jgi:hypothetical protein
MTPGQHEGALHRIAERFDGAGDPRCRLRGMIPMQYNHLPAALASDGLRLGAVAFYLGAGAFVGLFFLVVALAA